MFDREMLTYLVCPVTGSALKLSKDGQWLISRVAKLAYPVLNGVPILLEGKAKQWSEDDE